MENQKKYRITKHQSELAVKVVGASQADLFANSAYTLFDVMVADLDKVDCKDHIPLEIEGTDRDDLMVNWMRELLYLYQGSGYLLKDFQIREVKDTIVKAEVAGEKIDLTATRSSRKSPPSPFIRAAWIRPAISGRHR